MRTTSLSLATLTLLGCGPAATPEPIQAEHSPPLEVSRLPPTPVSPLEVHEWGLIDVYTDGQIELAAGPGTAASRPAPHPSRPPSRPPMPMRKPVVYFHLDESVPSIDVRVDVHIVGRMIETWPTPTAQTGVDHISWQASLTQCPGGANSAADDSAVRNARANCQTPDHVCEVADLPTYETRDGACVNVGAQHGRFLFYRGELAQGTTFPLSLAQTMHAQPGLPVISAIPTVTVTTPLEHPVFLVSAGAGSVHHVQVGEPTMLPTSTNGLQPNLPRADTLIAPFTAELVRAGLTEDEARAFMAAWSEELFGPGAPRRGATAPESTLLYFLPRADIERLAPMTVDFVVDLPPGVASLRPTPPSLERVMVVRQHFAM